MNKDHMHVSILARIPGCEATTIYMTMADLACLMMDVSTEDYHRFWSHREEIEINIGALIKFDAWL